MSEITGKNLVAKWIHTGGTVDLSSDFRSLAINPTVDLAETTAGADTDKTYIPTVKDATIEWSGLYQSGGTALENALAPGTGGTLVIYPEGTASGKPIENYPAIALGVKKNIPYKEVVELSCSFQKNGPKTVS